MNIGRAPLSNAEFTRLWSVLYQEFHTLSSTGTCNAACVYSTIYRICTSTIPYEDKLYWKIGDFLHNRCKEHYEQISNSSNYLEEYARSFRIYERLVRSIHKLGCFLNECVHGRKLDDFGFLLWERGVVQHLPSTFFDDIYDFSGSPEVRLFIISSLVAIVPDPSQPLLYYRERYERLALERMRGAYSSHMEEDILALADRTLDVVAFETARFPDYFIPESSAEHQKMLSSILFRDKLDLTLRVKAFLEHSISLNKLLGAVPAKRFSIAIGIPQNADTAKAAFAEEGTDPPQHVAHAQYGNTPSGNTRYSTHSFCISDSSEDEHLMGFVFSSPEESVVKMSILNTIAPLIQKKYPRIPLLTSSHLTRQHSPHHRLLLSFASLPYGIILLKRAYACYLIEVINNNPELLSGSIPLLYAACTELDVFNICGVPVCDTSVCSTPVPGADNSCRCGDLEKNATIHGISKDFSSILISIVRNALQRVKPCFTTRLSRFTQHIVLKEEPNSESRPFHRSNEMFSYLITFVPDKREFLNIYHATLKERLLGMESDLATEREVLATLGLDPSDRLCRMIDDIQASLDPSSPENNLNPESSKNFLLLNYSNWGIEPEGGDIKISERLLDQIREQYRGKEWSLLSEKGRLLLRGMENGEVEDRKIQLAHQYSKLKVRIGSSLFIMNLLQYSVVEALGAGTSLDEISEGAGMARSLKDTVDGLVEDGLLVSVDGTWELCVQPANNTILDLTARKTNRVKELDICLKSYLQALISRILKRARTMERTELEEETQKQTQVAVDPANVTEAIIVLAEKGICECAGESVEFVP